MPQAIPAIPSFTPRNQNQTSFGSEERTELVGIPSLSVQDNQLRIGDQHTSSIRSYTYLKNLHRGSFGVVSLCDWHSTLPPNLPLPAMQTGPGVKPEFKDKRLVAVKRVIRSWPGGWTECLQMSWEIKVLRSLPFHPNIILLYDAFVHSPSQQLYLVFEPMEGNLYQLIKTRKGRSFTGLLIASIFRQIVSGLFHVHASGYFHRDLKPENILVTTTGHFEYPTVSPIAPLDAPKEKDLIVIIKLSDFGLAREIDSEPPYISTRWYRAPEVLLLGRTYSSAVDMWALGVIMAEALNLRPLFPGTDQVDQVAKICAILGDPSHEYGVDSSGITIGGGPWSNGIELANAVRFQSVPENFASLFEPQVPTSFLVIIRGLLKYDPRRRLTSRECLEHPFLREMEAYLT